MVWGVHICSLVDVNVRIPKVTWTIWYTYVMHCPICRNVLRLKQKKYCSNRCQHEQQYQSYIASWKKGQRDGNRGLKVKLLSKHLRRYLLLKFGEKCSKCAWSEQHQITGLVPLEIDHIDGNAQNNSESNLQLLCPNCHSLTPHFRNLNRGNGRPWRK